MVIFALAQKRGKKAKRKKRKGFENENESKNVYGDVPKKKTELHQNGLYPVKMAETDSLEPKKGSI